MDWTYLTCGSLASEGGAGSCPLDNPGCVEGGTL